MSRRRYVQLAGVAVTGVALAGCSGGDGSGDGDGDGSGDGEWTQTSTVEMNDELKFVPQKIEVSAGTEVTWENVGSIGHTVTAYEDEIPDGAEYFASGGFDSQSAASDGYSNGEGNVGEGGTYSHTFETTGTYEYYCIPHEMNGMTGQVRVV